MCASREQKAKRFGGSNGAPVLASPTPRTTSQFQSQCQSHPVMGLGRTQNMSRLVRRTSAALHSGPKRPPPGCGGHARTLRTVLSGSGLTHRVTRRPSVAYSITCTGRSTSCARGRGQQGRGIAQRQRSGAGGDRSAHARGCRAGWAAAATMRRGRAQRFAPAAPEAQRRPLSRARRRRGADTPLLVCPDARTRAHCVQRGRACAHAHSPP